MHIIEFEGVRFFEGRPPNARVLGPVNIRIGGILRSAQLKTLDDVKGLIVKRVRLAGGNAVVDFRYGQRSVGWLDSLFQRDDVNWYGSGQIAVLT